MKRNIIASFLVQLVIICFYYLIYGPLSSMFGDYYITYASMFFLIIAFLLYFITGWVLLKPIELKKNRLISVFALSAFLMVISLTSFGVSFRINNQSAHLLINSTNSIINPLVFSFLVFTGLIPEKIIQNATMNNLILIFQIILPAIIPSFGIWLGLKLNKKQPMSIT